MNKNYKIRVHFKGEPEEKSIVISRYEAVKRLYGNFTADTLDKLAVGEQLKTAFATYTKEDQ